jgi:hypothetical protein
MNKLSQFWTVFSKTNFVSALHIGKIYWLLSFFLNLLLLFLVYLNLNAEDFKFVLNSDTLNLPSIFQDVFVEGNSFKGWVLSGAPNFVPDMFVFFLIGFICKNILVSFFVYSFFQTSLILFLLSRIYKAVAVNVNYYVLTIANCLFALFFMAALVHGRLTFALYFILVSYHTGAFIMGLAALLFTIRYSKGIGRNNLLFLFITGYMGVFSDKLFLILYSVPTLMTMIVTFKGYSKKNSEYVYFTKSVVYLFLTNIAFVFLGILSFNLLKSSSLVTIIKPFRMMDFVHVKESYSIITEHITYFLKSLNIESLIILLTLISVGLSIYHLFKRIKMDKIAPERKSIFLFLIFSVFYSFIVFAAPVINGSYSGFDTIRYNIYVYYFSIWNLGLFIQLLAINGIEKILKLTAFALFFIILVFIPVKFATTEISRGTSNFFLFKDKKIESIDYLAKNYGLKNGICDYWSFRPFNLFTRSNSRMYAVFKDYTAYHLTCNPNWFWGGGLGRFQTPVFNFILLNDLPDTSVLYKTFGKNIQFYEHEGVKIAKVPEFNYLVGNYIPHLTIPPSPVNLNILCNADTLSNNKEFLKCGNFEFRGGAAQSGTKSFSGKYSLHTLGSFKSVFGFKIYNVRKGERYRFSVLKDVENYQGALVVQTEDISLFYSCNGKAGAKRKNWFQLETELEISEKMDGTTLSVFCWNDGVSDIYFDDFEILRY